jgi:hypothetical protein
MPARELDEKAAPETAAPEVAPVEPEATKTEFAEGEVPAVAAAAPVAAGPTASEQAFDNHSPLYQGMHRWEDYKAACEAAGKPEKWNDAYVVGHTEAKGFIQPDKYRKKYDWQLERHTSASKAIQDFVKGPTICDYRIAGVATDFNRFREEVGDKKFDKLLGSANHDEDAAVPADQRMHLSASLYTIPLLDQLRERAKAMDEAAKPKDAEPTTKQEARVEEKPKVSAELDQDPVVVAQELGMQQADRELV